MAENETMTAEIITAPVIELELMGEKRELRFDNRAAMMAERYWRETTGQRISYFFILGELNARTYGGLLAVTYGALASAEMHRNRSRSVPKPVTSVRAFDEGVNMSEMLGCMEEVRLAVDRSLPRLPKNAESPATSGADGHGTPSPDDGSSAA